MSEHGDKIYGLMKELFPICRSLTGDGLRYTLDRIAEEIPLVEYEVPSGTQVFDWTIPDEWNPRSAWIETPSGKRICDFSENNLHLLNYSMPFEGEVGLEELKKHIYTRPDLPDAIPYVTSYYQRRWGFCMRHSDFEALQPGKYRVMIDVELRPGSLTYADLVLPGDTEEEILLSTYICHPSMANNELSGPALTTYLAKYLMAKKNRHYTYRFVFAPENIGVVTYLSRNLRILQERVRAGYVVTCVGGPGQVTYMESRAGDSLVDKVTRHVLRHRNEGGRILDFTHSGSDERRYNAPGVDLPVGCLVRTRFFDYPEYHTSLDDLNFVSVTQMAASYDLYCECIDTLELNRRYRVTTLCEPNLGSRGLYPTVGAPDSVSEEVDDFLALCSYCDGVHDLIDIADLHRKPISNFSPRVRSFLEAGLLEVVEA